MNIVCSAGFRRWLWARRQLPACLAISASRRRFTNQTMRASRGKKRCSPGLICSHPPSTAAAWTWKAFTPGADLRDRVIQCRFVVPEDGATFGGPFAADRRCYFPQIMPRLNNHCRIVTRLCWRTGGVFLLGTWIATSSNALLISALRWWSPSRCSLEKRFGRCTTGGNSRSRSGIIIVTVVMENDGYTLSVP